IEAVNANGQHAYDLILMDCQMPEMDGYAATKEIRKREKENEHIPIIAMTAYALKGDQEKCFQAGMDDYLSKPFDTKNLAMTLNRWLKTQPSHFVAEKKVDEPKESQQLIDMNRMHEIFGEDSNAIREFIKIFVDSTTDIL